MVLLAQLFHPKKPAPPFSGSGVLEPHLGNLEDTLKILSAVPAEELLRIYEDNLGNNAGGNTGDSAGSYLEGFESFVGFVNRMAGMKPGRKAGMSILARRESYSARLEGITFTLGRDSVDWVEPGFLSGLPGTQSHEQHYWLAVSCGAKVLGQAEGPVLAEAYSRVRRK